MEVSIMTYSNVILSIMTQDIVDLIVPLSIKDIMQIVQFSYCYAKCRYADCCFAEYCGATSVIYVVSLKFTAFITAVKSFTVEASEVGS